MKHPFYTGLSGKIALIFLLAFLFVVLPVNSVIYSKLKTTLITADEQQLRAEAEKLLSQINLDPLIIPLPAMEYLIKVQIGSTEHLEPLFSSPQFPILEGEFFLLDSFDWDTLKILSIRKPIEFGNGDIVFSIAHSNGRLEEQLADFRLYLFYITGAAVILIIVVVFALSGIMLQPLKKIIEASARIDSSRKIEKIPIPKSNDESRQLAIALNSMLGRIEASNNMQQKFFDAATHELKTPLSVMKAELFLAHGSATESPTKNTLASVLNEVERLERTIFDFLLVSQLKSQSLIPRMEKFNLADIVYSSLTRLKTLADEKGISFSINQSDDVDFTIEADPDKIQTATINLIENAIRYSPVDSVVAIQLILKPNSKPILEIENVTLQPIQHIETLSKDRYMNSDSARGMGLGLWICRQIMELHGGRLEFKQSKNFFTVKCIF